MRSAAAGVCLAAAVLAAVSSGPLGPDEARGKRIYLEGASDSPIVALLGEVETDASTLPCASCHGRDGGGTTEGGVAASNLTWAALTKPDGVEHPGGRRHPPYTEVFLERAILRGLDPAGNELLAVMPRYRMTPDDLAALIAYLKRLGGDFDPGVSSDAIRIGTLLPLEGRFAAQGRAIRAALEACFTVVNERGGIYQRRLELEVVPVAAGEAAAALRGSLEREPVFALAAPFMAGAEGEIAELAREFEIPLVGPFTLDPQLEPPVDRHVFYLTSGVRGQARALVDGADRVLGERRPAAVVLARPDLELNGIAAAVEDQARRRGWRDVTELRIDPDRFDAPGLARHLHRSETGAVFLTSAGAPERALLVAADRIGWRPLVLLPGALGGDGIFGLAQLAGERLLVSFPTLPAERAATGLEAYRAAAERFRLPERHRSMQLAAFAAARILVEGLKRAGRRLSRERLLEALDGLHEFDTGLMRPVSYGPNRRVGAPGAHVVSIDPVTRRLVSRSGGWIDPR